MLRWWAHGADRARARDHAGSSGGATAAGLKDGGHHRTHSEGSEGRGCCGRPEPAHEQTADGTIRREHARLPALLKLSHARQRHLEKQLATLVSATSTAAAPPFAASSTWPL